MKTNRFHFIHGEPVRPWLARTVTGLINPIVKRALRSPRPTGETVHVTRTTTKKLRALLRLLRPVISANTFERENARLKAAAARLAAGRDHRIACETLASLVEDSGNDHSRKLLICLKKRPSTSPGTDPAPAVRDAARQLEIAGRILLRTRIAGAGWNAIGPGLTETYRRARRRMKTALRHPGAETFHQWRIPAKHLYYQLQWLEPLWPARFTTMIQRLHQLEQMLGADHDLSVMKSLLFPLPGNTAHPSTVSALKKAARKRSLRLRHRCQSLGKKLFRSSTHKFSTHCHQHWQEWMAQTGSKVRQSAPCKDAVRP